GYEWQSLRDKTPKACPDCRSRKWQTPPIALTTFQYKCKRCGHEWNPNTSRTTTPTRPPLRCSLCLSRYWNSSRTRAEEKRLQRERDNRGFYVERAYCEEHGIHPNLCGCAGRAPKMRAGADPSQLPEEDRPEDRRPDPLGAPVQNSPGPMHSDTIPAPPEPAPRPREAS